MKNGIGLLFPYEKETLLEALRRDLRNELAKVSDDPGWADYHRTNAYFVKKVLEALNPKRR